MIIVRPLITLCARNFGVANLLGVIQTKSRYTRRDHLFVRTNANTMQQSNNPRDRKQFARIFADKNRPTSGTPLVLLPKKIVIPEQLLTDTTRYVHSASDC